MAKKKEIDYDKFFEDILEKEDKLVNQLYEDAEKLLEEKDTKE